ncbi:Rossman fold protein, TIGR00730 family [Helicobacter monodelphidis]|uniref:LOG family protein n=1 Tax=Helicobacter sp. 15-1451 TaxID=2004995 RepID=UPI000DCD0A8A|nr:TIGR00730 family Rossman fold protein [Helicobacter sp. 15-1451]RAX58382.1 Rossman fold protein, TIGR00730 family [Helicobacter sp. 15-1451]
MPHQKEPFRLNSLKDIQHIECIIEQQKHDHSSKGLVFFGSARLQETNQHYQAAYRVAKECAKKGYFIISGGGGGIMEAANRGAKEVGTLSVGLNIRLAFEQFPNPYLDMEIMFEEFWLRKLFFDRIASTFILFAGGFGTLDELFDILVLIQTQKRTKRPIILYGEEFWQPMIKFFSDSLLQQGCINANELNLLQIANSTEEVLKILSPSKDLRKKMLEGKI